MLYISDIAKAVMLRANQLADSGDAASLETNYTAATIAGAADGTDVPVTALKTTVLGAAKRIASICGRSGNPVLTLPLMGVSITLGIGDTLPAADINGANWIGAFHSFIDVVDGITPLTEGTVREIGRFNRSSFHQLSAYKYVQVGDQLIHTRPQGVVAKGCSWSTANESAAYDGDGPVRLAEECHSWLVAETLKNLPQENWFVSEAQYYAQLAQECERSVTGGVIPAAKIPDATATVEPVAN